MLASAPRHASSGVRAALSSLLVGLALTALVSGGGCTLLVSSQLSEKPLEGAGGAGGQGGEGGASSTASQGSSAAHGSSSTGGLMCKPDTANCNGLLLDGCEAKLNDDPKNCGACKKVCGGGQHCKDGKCE